jgi:hypothetical protein
MDEHFWVHLLPWRQKDKAESKPDQIKLWPKLEICREKGWGYLELLLVNRSRWTVWVEEATVVLADLNAIRQFDTAAGRAIHEIRQNIWANDELSVSLTVAIYNGAGKPQGPYSCLVRTDVRYRVLEEWYFAKLETYRIEMAGLIPISLRSARWYEKKIEATNDPADHIM